MINKNRLRQLTDLMTDREWDLLLLYGHSWRKDFFRCLVNFNFSGPHAAAGRSLVGQGEESATILWDIIDPPEQAQDGVEFAPVRSLKNSGRNGR